jgi:CRISPR-associated protein Csc1
MTLHNPAHVYRCEITLWEHTFFASREISAFFQTEPVIGNYALAYALGLCAAPYTCSPVVRYKLDLLPLNEQGIYVTPGTILGHPRFTMCQFNAQTDAYWYAFANNAIVTPTEGRRVERDGPNWYLVDPASGARQKVTPSNFPQHGRVKMLALSNRAVCYVITRQPLDQPLPAYIRLGKWMSKAHVEVSHTESLPKPRANEVIGAFLNPADLPDSQALGTFDLVSVHPVPLIRHVEMSGDFYQASDGAWMPAGMRFGVENLP